MTSQEATCDRCGVVYGIGCSPWCKDGHAPVQPRGGFEPHFDMALGEHVTGWGDVRQHMRRKHLDFRDHPSKSQLSEWRDKVQERKAREARG